MSGIAGVAALALMALLGLVFGSFGNVVVWRLPRGESLSRPPSHCPNCGHEVRWRDNVPVLSWLLLRGRCRDCDEPISVRYPLVEAGSALLWLGSGLVFGVSWRAIACACLLYLLLLLSLIDAQVGRLPNVLVATTAAVGLGFAIVSQLTGVPSAPLIDGGGMGPLAGPLWVSVLGAALGAAVSGVVALIYASIRRRPGLGMGDVKLLAAIGVFTGPYVVMVYVLGNILGAVGVLLGVAARRPAVPVASDGDAPGEPSASVDDIEASPIEEEGVGGSGDASGNDEPLAARRVPFGPYLAVATLLTVVAGPAIWGWYLSVVGL